MMAVTPGQLTNREQVAVTSRGEHAQHPHKIPSDGAEKATEDGYEDRLKKAKTVQPTDEERHCVDCFEKGRNAAVATIEGNRKA